MNCGKVIAALQISVDGFIEGRDGEKDWVESWADAIQLVPDVAAFVVGAGMYPGYGEYWGAIYANPDGPLPFQEAPASESEVAYARLAEATRHLIVSSSLESVSWPPKAEIVRDIAELEELRDQPGGNVYVAGGATLVANLLNADLVDEIRLIVHPLILRGGKALFGNVTRRPLELVRAESNQSGRAILTYQT
jgi:dihydrofolate reductase